PPNENEVAAKRLPHDSQRSLPSSQSASCLRRLRSSRRLRGCRTDSREGIPRRSPTLGEGGTAFVRGSARRLGRRNGTASLRRPLGRILHGIRPVSEGTTVERRVPHSEAD